MLHWCLNRYGRLMLRVKWEGLGRVLGCRVREVCF